MSCTSGKLSQLAYEALCNGKSPAECDDLAAIASEAYRQSIGSISGRYDHLTAGQSVVVIDAANSRELRARSTKKR